MCPPTLAVVTTIDIGTLEALAWRHPLREVRYYLKSLVYYLKDEGIDIAEIDEGRISSHLSTLMGNQGGTRASRVMQEASVLFTLDALSGSPEGSFGLLPVCRKFIPHKVTSLRAALHRRKLLQPLYSGYRNYASRTFYKAGLLKITRRYLQLSFLSFSRVILPKVRELNEAESEVK